METDIEHDEKLIKKIKPSMKMDVPKCCDFVVCGHVHGAYKHIWYNDIPIINVGVDVWGYKPISLDTLKNYLQSI